MDVILVCQKSPKTFQSVSKPFQLFRLVPLRAGHQFDLHPSPACVYWQGGCGSPAVPYGSRRTQRQSEAAPGEGPGQRGAPKQGEIC